MEKDGSRVLRPGTHLTVTIGDVPQVVEAAVPGAWVRQVLAVTGNEPVVLSRLPPQ